MPSWGMAVRHVAQQLDRVSRSFMNRARGSRRDLRQEAATEELVSIRNALAGAFAAIALVFTVGLAASHTFVAQIRSAAADIVENSAPTISSLSAMRSVLRRIQLEVDEVVDSCTPGGECPAPAKLMALQDELRQAWSRYRALPASPGEVDLWPRVVSDLDQLGRALRVTLDTARAGRLAEARLRYRDLVAPAVDQLDADVARIQDFDEQDGVASAAKIEGLARLATAASAAVALLTIALTVLAGLLVIRLVDRYGRSVHERTDDLEQFAARVAHDLRGPLTSTSAALHSAARLSSGRAREALDRGQHGLQRVRRLVDDLLEFARAGALHKSATADLGEVVADVVEDLGELAAEHRVELRVEGVACASVACSRGVLASIVQNLVQNAIRHMGRSPVRVVHVRAPAAGGRRVRIEVEDSGPGLPEALGERVFEPFVRGARPEVSGYGIGLATVKRFVTAHGGRIGFLPKPGRGTVFWLEMPRARERRVVIA
jgi:signal transduction histidine kinase